ncbi:haloacid dehalogenase-like hydrolase domain-containing protein 2 isoform X2 [Rhodnius prolixus]|uniref:Haloacid dehalogenase-like hydrolase domain-containing protein 2 n=2 Tax=Rhodnius prolixus TaxID=13249 RepID=R4G4A7_RHOPR
MSNLKAVLIDLSGTLHIEDESTPEAVKALNRLRKCDLNIKFLTNTTKESRRNLHERLLKLGFQIKVDEIYTSLWAARELIIKEQLNNPLLLVDDNALEDFIDVNVKDDKYDAVVIGLAPQHFNRTTLNKAFRILLDGGRFIAINKSKYYMRKEGLALAAGAIVKSLEYATGIEATIVGKPNAEFFQGALDGFKPDETVMIGDDVLDDIGGARNLGIRGYLVKTGKYRAGDENKIDPAPFKCVDCFSAAVEDIVSSLR